MATSHILIKGLPGSGKTTLSRQLGGALSVPVVSKDAVKEMLADIARGNVPGALEYVATGIAQSVSPRVVEIWCTVDTSEPVDHAGLREQLALALGW